MTASVVHGETGLGGFPLPISNRALDPRPAWRLIYDEALAAGDELEIIAIGPMTNIAIALLRYPELAGMIRRIVSMGGSTEWGNRGAYGEFNYYVDPHAAQIVFQSGIPVHMVGLNVTMKTGMSEAEINSLYAAVAQKEYEELLDFYRQVYAENDLGFQVVAIHDALAVAYAIDPSVLHLEKAHVEVDTSSGPCRGRTVLSYGSPSHSLAATAVNKPQFLTMIRDALARIHDIRV